jgi:hypothetical protein
MERHDKPVAELTHIELLRECADWMSDINSAYWEAQEGMAPSENRGKALLSRLYELADKLDSAEWALCRVVHEHTPQAFKVKL